MFMYYVGTCLRWHAVGCAVHSQHATALAKRASMQGQQRASSVERFGLTNAVMAMRKSPLQMVCLHGPRQRARLVSAMSIR